jgi:hypothetical protein
MRPTASAKRHKPLTHAQASVAAQAQLNGDIAIVSTRTRNRCYQRQHPLSQVLRSLPTVLVGLVILTGAPGGGAYARDYVLFAQEIIDKPLKTQVLLKVIVPVEISKAELEKVLMQIYQEQRSRTGFKYHPTPTHVAVFAFHNREYAADGPGYIGRLLRIGDGKIPDIDVREKLLVALRKPAQTKFGLSEAQRRRIWDEVLKSEDRAERQAEQRYPVPPIWTPGYDVNAAAAILKERDQMSDSLVLRYRAEILRKHKVTKEQWLEIRDEGALEKRWPRPPEPNRSARAEAEKALD